MGSSGSVIQTQLTPINKPESGSSVRVSAGRPQDSQGELRCRRALVDAWARKGSDWKRSVMSFIHPSCTPLRE